MLQLRIFFLASIFSGFNFGSYFNQLIVFLPATIFLTPNVGYSNPHQKKSCLQNPFCKKCEYYLATCCRKIPDKVIEVLTWCLYLKLVHPGRLLISFTEPLEGAHGNPGFCGTRVDKHCFRQLMF